MSQVEATGAQGINLMSLAQLVAGSPAFQHRRQVNSIREAEAWVYWPWAPAEANKLPRPCAVLEQADLSYTKHAGGGRNYLLPSGSAMLTITDIDHYPTDPRSGFIDFTNFVDGVLADVVNKAAEENRICITEIRTSQQPVYCDPTVVPAEELYLWARYEIVWDPVG